MTFYVYERVRGSQIRLLKNEDNLKYEDYLKYEDETFFGHIIFFGPNFFGPKYFLDPKMNNKIRFTHHPPPR